MENLYQVIVVTRDREILLDTKVVAADPGEAELEADVHAVIKGKGFRPKNVTVIADVIGHVKVRKPIQRVKVVDVEDNDLDY